MGVAMWLHDAITRCFHFEEQGCKTFLGKFTGKITHLRLHISVTENSGSDVTDGELLINSFI